MTKVMVMVRAMKKFMVMVRAMSKVMVRAMTKVMVRAIYDQGHGQGNQGSQRMVKKLIDEIKILMSHVKKLIKVVCRT